MRTPSRSALLAAVVSIAFSVTIAPTFAAAPDAAHYSAATTKVGKMLDDPAANALLKKLIPTIYANEMFQSAGRDLTLKDIQQYEPEALSDANLVKIQTELDKIPAKP